MSYNNLIALAELAGINLSEATIKSKPNQPKVDIGDLINTFSSKFDVNHVDLNALILEDEGNSQATDRIYVDVDYQGGICVMTMESKQYYLNLTKDEVDNYTDTDLIEMIRQAVNEAAGDSNFIVENVGEKNNSLNSAFDAESNVYADIITKDENEEQEELVGPANEQAKQAIDILKGCLDECREKIKEFEETRDGNDRGKREFYTKVVECGETLIEYLSDGEAGFKKAGHFLNTLMSQIQEQLPRDLWTLLSWRPTLSDRFKEIEQRSNEQKN